MIIYNVTVSLVDQTIHEEWLNWMKTKHIPDVMNTGCFLSNKICRLMVDDEITYAIQYTCKDLATLEKYQTGVFTSITNRTHRKIQRKIWSISFLIRNRSRTVRWEK